MADLFSSDPRYGAILAPEITGEVIEKATENSLVLRRFRRLRNMNSRQTILNVRSELPTAGAVNPIPDNATAPNATPNHTKPVTTQKFDPLNIYAGEFAAIKVFRDADLADALSNGYDIIRNDIPLISSQFGAAIDRAVVWGIGRPSEWASLPGLFPTAQAAGNVINASANPYLDMFASNGVRDRILLSGYMPNGIASSIRMMGQLAGLTDEQGRSQLVPSMADNIPDRLAGMSLDYVRNGSWQDTLALMLMADFDSLVYSIREDITTRTTRDGIIVDGAGTSHNLAQENKTALIMHMRLGWQILDPVTQLSESPVPFSFYSGSPSGIATP